MDEEKHELNATQKKNVLIPQAKRNEAKPYNIFMLLCDNTPTGKCHGYWKW